MTQKQQAQQLLQAVQDKYGAGWDLLGPTLQRAVLADEMVSHLLSQKVTPGSQAEKFQLLFVEGFCVLHTHQCLGSGSNVEKMLREAQLVGESVKEVRSEVTSGWTCCGQPVEVRGLDVYCTVCKKTSR